MTGKPSTKCLKMAIVFPMPCSIVWSSKALLAHFYYKMPYWPVFDLLFIQPDEDFSRFIRV